jgi:hypothetical protein
MGAAILLVAAILVSCGEDQSGTTAPPEPNASAASVTATTNWYVKPNGQIPNSGTSYGSPWPLSYALSGAGGRIQPGDTIWLEGGTYGPDSNYVAPTSLNGNVTNRIVFKQYPGERATIDGRLQVRGRI